MTDELTGLLRHVQKTNPEMTMERLIDELERSYCLAMGLVMVWKNSERQDED